MLCQAASTKKRTSIRAKCHDILDCFLAKVMVDAEDLTLVKDLLHQAIQRFSRGQVVSKGFLDHHARIRRASGLTEAGARSRYYRAIGRLRLGPGSREALI